MRITALLSVVAFIATGVPASAQGIAGTWKVTYDSDIRTDGDAITVNKRAKAELVLQMRGDSVFGTFKGDGPDNEARTLSGTFDGKALKLTSGTRRGTVRINGKPTDLPMRTDWMGALDAGGLRGTMFIQIGDRPAPPRTWEATR